MGLAALRPDLPGPILVAGSPLSYWAGAPGLNPMRYTGGLLGGSWMTHLMSDLGAGKFDGADLVLNFEGLNPGNTWWSKYANLFDKADTEPARFLEFERWWGGYFLMNREEITAIVDQLFVGNKLARGEVTSADGKLRLDLRNIRSPICVLCSWGDDITPPQQALNWILDLYASDDDLVAQGQTIVYCVHPKVGHLGIFVSGAVAQKEERLAKITGGAGAGAGAGAGSGSGSGSSSSVSLDPKRKALLKASLERYRKAWSSRKNAVMDVVNAISESSGQKLQALCASIGIETDKDAKVDIKDFMA
jgi:hypothetical protein